MRYVSTRGNHAPVGAAEAIHLGMVPGGGLFAPEDLPRLDLGALRGLGYREIARRALGAFLEGFSEDEIASAAGEVYGPERFDVPSVADLVPLDDRRYLLELFHGPTGAFKDVALQILPRILAAAKRKLGVTSHTVILVATSGDTGKAALEGFRDGEGLSVVVFYPHGGVSEIQRLQMVTTEGSNVHVFGVRGTFDDCQGGAKRIFADRRLAARLEREGLALSSANSINWGRLCPQIVYYVWAYLRLVDLGRLREGERIDVCVPTGNFGNILAAFYARSMGLPIEKLVCASNRNKVLPDFFATGVYDRNREFHRTISPSMDILVSSNLERFLFEAAGRDPDRVRRWYAEFEETGRFAVDGAAKAAMDEVVAAGWADEARTLEAIRAAYRASGRVLDPHTAVGAAVCEDFGPSDRVTVIAATASPYKFSRDVLRAIAGEEAADEFRSVARLEELTGLPAHRSVAGLRERPVRHDRLIGVGAMEACVLEVARARCGTRS
ncbi:MAG: threonine synthase [Planctomycetota bacterium]